jgi:ubiquinol-cytochrome c reductase iron-sulfur subunit
MSTQTADSGTAAGAQQFDPDDRTLSRFDLVREGARRDGVEIVHYAPRFPVPGTNAERRVERTITWLFGLAGLAGLAFVVIYIVTPVGYRQGSNMHKWATPLMGATLGLSLLCLGLAIVTYAKKLLPEEVSVQDRHPGPSPSDERKLTAATILNMGDELGLARRPFLFKGAIALGLAPLGLAIGAPFIGGLIVDPHKGEPLMHTGFDPKLSNGEPVRLVREDHSPIRPEEVSVGGQMTVYPGIAGGTTNEYADSPTLLIHLRQEDADALRANLKHVSVNSQDRKLPNTSGNMWGNYVAYSKICTHAGCPASLYEQQTNRLLCPCHQSQFDIKDNARPIFGPATRRLPMLPINVDAEGFLVATSDYQVPVGPGFWERS